MKKIITHALTLSVLFVITSSLCNGQVNTSAPKFNAQVLINRDLLPSNNNTMNLGSATKSWRSLYLDSNIYLKDSVFIHNTGIANTFVGEQAGNLTNHSKDNTGVGFNVLRNTTTGYYNAAIGALALNSNDAGTQNTACGAYTLVKNTEGNGNTATGFYSLYRNTSGNQNTATGYYALNSVTTGSSNTAIGASALQPITTQSYNTAIGNGAGWSYYGSKNTFVGNTAAANGNDFFNSSAFGNEATVSASNQVRIGNSGVTSIGGQVSWSTLSDGRVKKNIKQNVPGLSFINKLKPVTYNVDLNAVDALIKPQSANDTKRNIITATKEETEARKVKEQIVYTGLIAQDVEKAAKDLNYNFSGVDVAKNDKDLYSIRYSDFVMPLIQAVQELSKQNDTKDVRIDTLEQLLSNQQKEIDELKSLMHANTQTSFASKQTSSFMQPAKLEQNLPNPTTSSTTIKYFIPGKISSAILKITNTNGMEIKSITLSSKNNGQIILSTSDLTAGTYFYSLIADGKIVDTKQMVIVH